MLGKTAGVGRDYDMVTRAFPAPEARPGSAHDCARARANFRGCRKGQASVSEASFMPCSDTFFVLDLQQFLKLLLPGLKVPK